MRLLLDTNVILDVMLHREPFYRDSFGVYKLVENRAYVGCVSSSAITDIFYLARKELRDAGLVYRLIDMLYEDFTIAPVYESAIKDALALRWKDFEDAVQYMTARENGIDCIITRNVGDFESFGIACMSPADFLSRFRD